MLHIVNLEMCVCVWGGGVSPEDQLSLRKISVKLKVIVNVEWRLFTARDMHV